MEIWQSLSEAVAFGVAVAFMLVGIAGIIVPILPGMLLVWLSLLAYAWYTDFAIISPWVFGLLTILAAVTGLANVWLPLLGAKKTGAAKRALVLGFVGGIIGTFVMPLIGTVIGYALGIIIGEYLKHQDLRTAVRASVGGVAGWGISAIVELLGASIILITFVGIALFG
ncbi:MAG: DUF456 domain-containing protein [Candidatus Promineifilaceae bacterium]